MDHRFYDCMLDDITTWRLASVGRCLARLALRVVRGVEENLIWLLVGAVPIAPLASTHRRSTRGQGNPRTFRSYTQLHDYPALHRSASHRRCAALSGHGVSASAQQRPVHRVADGDIAYDLDRRAAPACGNELLPSTRNPLVQKESTADRSAAAQKRPSSA